MLGKKVPMLVQSSSERQFLCCGHCEDQMRGPSSVQPHSCPQRGADKPHLWSQDGEAADKI